jgi:hypothetical protein
MNKIEELERLEKAVWQIHGPYYPVLDISKEYQGYIDSKVIYYLKTGLPIEEIEKLVIKRKNKIRNTLREQGHKNVKPNIKI